MKAIPDELAGRCATCRHWNGPGPPGQPFAECQGIVHDQESWSTKHPVVLERERTKPTKMFDDWRSAEDVMQRLAVTVDGSGYCAQLMTQATFGCVFHEAKGPADAG